jgi:hypothetical protein
LLTLGSFCKNCGSSPKFWASFFHFKSYVINLTKKRVGLQLKRFLHKRIWSSCQGPMLWFSKYFRRTIWQTNCRVFLLKLLLVSERNW